MRIVRREMWLRPACVCVWVCMHATGRSSVLFVCVCVCLGMHAARRGCVDVHWRC
jgi:hypothetical protein